jgi:ATP-dependent exoDNAse (exonuclease V) beta subunit
MKQQKLFSNIIKFYTEYEFITQITDVQTHGYIDLLIEKEDGYYIIDYKLSDIDKPEYEKQIITYIEYIKTKTNKPVYGYLYSLNKNIVKEIRIKH